MPKFNEFIKGFEEKAETEQPKENRDQIIEKVNQKMMNAGTYGAFGDKENYEKSIAEAEELRKGLAPKAEEPKGKEQVQPKPNKQEEPKSQEYEGYRLEQTPDGKWINRDTYEYFDNKVEAQKDIDKFISSQSPNKPKQGSFEQVFGGEEEQEQEERAELFQKYRDMGYDKGDAQYKVQEVFNRRENAKKEEEFEKLASVGSVYADNGKITINTPWSKNQRNNYKNYLELRSYLDEKYGQGNYAIDYLQDELRDNGRETSAKLEVRLY